MKCVCIENNYNNANFTLNKEYEMSESGVRCDFGGMWCKFKDWCKPKVFEADSVFDFGMCKFQIVK